MGQDSGNSADRIGILNDTILRACRLSGLDRICRMVAETVLSLEQDSYVAVSLADHPGGRIRVRTLAGLGRIARAAGRAREMAFPKSDRPEEAADQKAEGRNEPVQGGSETVLLAEDEASLLEVLRQLLDGLGYRVLCAADGREAVETAEEYGESIDLLLTDLVMPEMDGRQAAVKISAARPGIAVLFMSGYTRDMMESGLPRGSRCGFIAKPFSLELLASRIREVLEG